MIGYYVHHHGRGHLHRAQAVAESWSRGGGPEVTGLSTLTRPLGWRGPWVQLPRDDRGVAGEDPTAGAQLHWAPLHDDGVRHRAATISAWVERARPDAVIVDVSAEATLLLRLHGVPVISFVLPGRRTDPAHLVAFRAASALVAAWPRAAETGAGEMTPGMPADLLRRVVRLGAVSRLCPRTTAGPTPGPTPRLTPGPRRGAVVLQGTGGDVLTSLDADGLGRILPDWWWKVLGGAGEWLERPAAALEAADVVVVGAGESALADVAALRRPAVVVPTPRPFDEQKVTASVLGRGQWPVVAVEETRDAWRPEVLSRASQLDGAAWAGWCDGRAAGRLLEVVRTVVPRSRIETSPGAGAAR